VAEVKPKQAEVDDSTEIQQPQKGRKAIALVVVAILAIGAAALYWRSTFTEDTDDAQINGHLLQVSSRINGTVVKVYVDENQQIKKGDLIAELDSRDYDVALENAEAQLAGAQAAATAANVNVPLVSVNTGTILSSAHSDVSASAAGIAQVEKQLDAAKARVAQSKANAVKTQSDLDRYKTLVAKDVISKQQYDGAVAANDAAKADLAAAIASEQAAQDGVRVAHEREQQSKAQLSYAQTAPQQVAVISARAKQALAEVQKAQAAVDQAKLNLSYTKIYAPTAGIVTRKSVELNQNVAPGQNLLTLVSLEGLWVTANFKETQLKHMSAGQTVDISVDSTGKKYHGKVTQIGGATGSVLSLFPPENATGNYVKVVQRVPVRIDFDNLNGEDANHVLRPGFSVVPEVHVK